nr:UvrD-helicase domain-containing protein [Isoptericola sediminis]
MIRDATDRTLVVNAGAGSGKTTALVSRVLALVLRDGVPLREIAAVTFTEKAGAELRDRLRVELEAVGRSADDPSSDWRRLTDVDVAELRRRADTALDDLDAAAIGTLHSFAQRILTEHAIAAGLPPVIEVLEEVGSSVAFGEQWSALQVALLDDDEIAPGLLLAMAGGVRLDDVRALARALGGDWDLIEDRVLDEDVVEDVPLVVRTDRVEELAEQVLSLRSLCRNPEDKLLAKLGELETALHTLRAAVDDGGRIAALTVLPTIKVGNVGQKSSWGCPTTEVRDLVKVVAGAAESEYARVLNHAVRRLTRWTARHVLEAAEDRRRDGRLEFHDLLVLARRLLRQSSEAREALHHTYTRLLLDEFQDTDPIQIELACRIAGGAGANQARWQDIELPPGRVFVVGDAKQSIYRFRRASIATYLDAAQHLGEQVSLTTNFRSVDTVLNWVNEVFDQVITPEEGRQSTYEALATHRRAADAPAAEAPGLPGVVVLGAEAHEDKPKADELREREAADVAATVRQALDDGWPVCDPDTHEWHPLRPRDVAVLVPARTSLPHLEAALEAVGVPYRAEASSLVYEAAEVRDLLACARAVADPSDELSLLTALRSPLFGCGDDDLWRWKHAGGRISLYSRIDEPAELADGPVGSSLEWLRGLQRRARWATPSEVLGDIVAGRRMLEVAAGSPRARDVWRQLRFVVDQARAWAEVSHGGLRAYLAWAAHQATETTRVAEAVLPETDVDAVRIMTIHAAKGLEFGFVALSGLTSRGRRNSGVSLLWPDDGDFSVRLRSGIETDDFSVAQPIDEQMDDLEKRRLLYVAATRARDHLVVSLHRTGNANTAAATLAGAGAGTLGESRFAATAETTGTAERAEEPAVVPPSYEDWLAGVTQARESSERDAAISASGLEGTEPAVVLAPGDEVAEGLAKGARNLELPPWSKGRYGSAIGRAVHGVLQAVDLSTGDGLDDAVAAQAVAEGVVGHEDLMSDLVLAALDSDLVRQAAERRHWRETYVGTVDDDGAVLEGYVDLIYAEDDGTLVVVDYKTDAVASGAYESRRIYYAPQLLAYARCVADATAAPVRAELLFLHPERAVRVPV